MRLKYPIIVPIQATVHLEIPSSIECKIVKESTENKIIVEIRYNSFIITTQIEKDNIY